MRSLAVTMDAWDSEQAVAFITRCLTIDPNMRPTAEQLLEDKWFANME